MTAPAPNATLPTRGVASTDLTEGQSRNIFQARLPMAEALFGFYDGKYPNLDGHVEFIGPSGSTTSKMFFQLKGTQEDVNFYDCDIEFLNYCFQSAEPCVLVLVNIPRDKVYWVHIDPEYISSVLGITDLATFTQQTKRITFSDAQVIDNNSAELIAMCRKHYADNAPRLAAMSAGTNARAGVTAEGDAVTAVGAGRAQPFADVQSKFVPVTEGMEDKMMMYHAFVYSLRPFYLDQRNDTRRRALLLYLGITDSEERYIIEALSRARLLDRTGDLLFVTDKRDALSTLNHYVDNGTLDLDEITRISSL